MSISTGLPSELLLDITEHFGHSLSLIEGTTSQPQPHHHNINDTISSLSGLPSELLLAIADHLDDRYMNTLVRTNKQIYDFLNRYLYVRDTIRPESKSLRWGLNNGVKGTIQHALDAGRGFVPAPKAYNIALQTAASQGYADFVELLLGIDVNPNFEEGSLCPLLLAAERGHTAVVNLLLARVDIDPNVTDTEFSSPLLHAYMRGHISVAKQLLARDDVDPNTLGLDGWATPLMLACANEDPEMVNLLLAKDGIDVNLSNIDGQTSLMIAARLRSVAVLESLLTRDDLDPNITDSGGCPISELALTEQNINRNLMGEGLNRTALMGACIAGHPDIVQLLMNIKGIDVNQQDSVGLTALCLAIRNNRWEAAKLLLRRDDIDPNLRDNYGRTALHWACDHDKECLEIVYLFLMKDNLDPNARDDSNGWTPLAFACDHVRVATVRLLLTRRDTDVNAVDNTGARILTLVRDNVTPWHGREIESLLRNKGAYNRSYPFIPNSH
ncbi:Ankyrin repeat-containing domain protein [Elaphomyces granulatus]